jgi:hypothetical protein
MSADTTLASAIAKASGHRDGEPDGMYVDWLVQGNLHPDTPSELKIT